VSFGQAQASLNKLRIRKRQRGTIIGLRFSFISLLVLGTAGALAGLTVRIVPGGTISINFDATAPICSVLLILLCTRIIRELKQAKFAAPKSADKESSSLTF
jgi:uncharacterized membrane protein YgaE (UPF0421/DUF939 family)